ncbi:hypothetical protein DL98DRAFT_530329 [Cadophora sp. DSE1049]|nr:hypothetical protein DL98DRAFT_530329 [Cadophora sp. DSE1049]
MQQMGRQMERLMFEEFRGQQELDSEGEKTGSTVIIIREEKDPKIVANTAKPDRIDSAKKRLRSEEECVRLIAVIGVGDRMASSWVKVKLKLKLEGSFRAFGKAEPGDYEDRIERARVADMAGGAGNGGPGAFAWVVVVAGLGLGLVAGAGKEERVEAWKCGSVFEGKRPWDLDSWRDATDPTMKMCTNFASREELSTVHQRPDRVRQWDRLGDVDIC